MWLISYMLMIAGAVIAVAGPCVCMSHVIRFPAVGEAVMRRISMARIVGWAGAALFIVGFVIRILSTP